MGEVPEREAMWWKSVLVNLMPLNLSPGSCVIVTRSSTEKQHVYMAKNAHVQ